MKPAAVSDDDARRAATLEQWLDVMLETSPVAMCIISAFENRCVRANSAMAELYGIPLAEILRSDPFTLALRVTHPDDLVTEQKLFAELAIGVRRSYQIEKRYVRPDGSIRSGLLTFSAIFDDTTDPAIAGPIRFVVAQSVDVTERKALAETLLRRDEELRHAQKIDGIGRLAAGVAHDFNNLLTVITGHAEVMRLRLDECVDASTTREMQSDLEAIVAASDRAARLTAQLLAYGRRESVMRRTIVLSDVVAALQRLLSRSIESSIQVEQSLSALGSICADPGQIGQVVMNLVLNARDAISAHGCIRVTTRDVPVHDAAAPGPGAWVALAVSDTGHGVSAEVQARMFEPFFTTRANRPGTQGTGLGLATVQCIVTESGGRIEVESAPGAGTCVTIFFPRVEGAAEELTTLPSTRLLRAPAPNSQRVLVVEDDPAVRSLIATVLLGAHYRVAVARDGDEALEFMQVAPEPFHLIVTDLVMPSVGGAALAERLHARGSQSRMLFISGYSNHAPSELSPYGRLLSKPFTPAQLLAAVASALPDPD